MPDSALKMEVNLKVGAPARQRCAVAAGFVATLTLALMGCTEAGGTEPSPTGEAGTNPAILLAAQLYTPDDYFSYVRVFPEVPEGNLDFADFREFGNANVYTHAGYVFVEEEGRLRRFSVSEQLELIDEQEFSWQDFGIAAINASYTVFVSEERAYTLAPELGVAIVWDPEAMVVTGSLDFDFDRPAAMETWAYDGHLVGDQVIWNVFSGDFDAPSVYPAVTLAIADAHADTPIRVVEDDRCLPGGPARVDEHGDYYVQAGGYFGYFYAYGDPGESARTCLLRVNAGSSEFDPDFLVDFKELTGSYVNEPWVHVADDASVVRAWDPDVAFPDDPEEFWDNAALRPFLIDTDAGTRAPYSDFDGWKAVSGSYETVDGTNYFQLSKTGYVEGGDADVFELHPEGTVEKFHLDGFLLGLKRIR